MAVAPLFIADMQTVKAKLRLSDASDTAQPLIDTATQAARVSFYDVLGAARVAEILTIPYEENPTSQQAALRVKANLCEHAMIRAILLRRMPVLFMDGGSQALDVWNREGLTREAPSDLFREIAALENEITNYLEDLSLGESNQSQIKVSSIGPTVPPQRPGDTVHPKYRSSVFGHWNVP